MTKPKAVICPYCGETQPATERCKACGGLFEALSRQATHNAMGPWFVRDANRPFQPGCSYETLVTLIERGQVQKMTLLRGPTTKQFWTIAKRVPGIAHLFGYCHACDASVDPGDHGCHVCGVPFGAYLDRNYLGLPEVRPMPWDADVDDARRMTADEGAATRAEALEWGRITPGGSRAISSFASDEELLAASSPGAPRHAPTKHPATTSAASALGSSRAALLSSAPQISATSTAPSIAGDMVPGPTARALQRRLAQQQRTINWLLLGMGLVIVLAILLAIRTLGTSIPGVTSSPTTTPGAQPLASGREPVESAPSPQDNPTPPSPLAASREPSTAPSTRPEPVEGPTTQPDASPPAVTPNPSQESPFFAEYERALALLTKSEQSDRPMDDRIRDADEALQILKNISATASADEQPADLAATITRAQQQLDRLRLGDFFP